MSIQFDHSLFLSFSVGHQPFPSVVVVVSLVPPSKPRSRALSVIKKVHILILSMEKNAVLFLCQELRFRSNKNFFISVGSDSSVWNPFFFCSEGGVP